MSRYVVRRLLVAVPVIFGISLVLFTILALAPGDPFEELATNPNVPPEVRMNLRAKFGLDDPLPVRYTRWLTSMLRGDWGFSFVSRVNVDTLIVQRLPTSLFVLGSARLLGLLIALPIGTDSALRPESVFDQVTTTFAFIRFVTLVPLQIGVICAGAVITEQIDRIPGIGSLLSSSVLANDTPVIMAMTFVLSCLVVIFTLVADVLYGWLDPRIAYR